MPRAKKTASQQMLATGETLTLNGHPIPEHLLQAIPYEMTDQGYAEKRQRDMRRRETEPHAVFGQGKWENELERLDESIEPWETDNPIESAKQLVPPEIRERMFFHLQSDRAFSREGSRGYIPAVDKDGKQIRVGNMTLVCMDKNRAARREQYFQNLREQEIQRATGNYKAKQERLLRDHPSQAHGLSVLDPGETVKGYSGVDDFGAPAISDTSATMGLQTSVGDLA